MIDPFAFARSEADADAELFALIAEYWRWEEAINKAAAVDDEDEVARLCSQAQAVRDRINEIHPISRRGILAALDFGSEMEDPDYWPEGAIEGLRAVVEREAQP